MSIIYSLSAFRTRPGRPLSLFMFSDIKGVLRARRGAVCDGIVKARSSEGRNMAAVGPFQFLRRPLMSLANYVLL